MPVGAVDNRVAFNPYRTNKFRQTVEIADNFLRRGAVAPNIILMHHDVTDRPVFDDLTEFSLIVFWFQETTLP